MDVVNLFDDVKLPDDSPADYCLVTDNIHTLTKGSKSHFTIYVISKPKDPVHLREPFSLIFYDSHEDVTKMSPAFIKKNACFMWDNGHRDEKGHANEWPESKRNRTEMIQLDFFRDEHDGGKFISYTWKDWYASEDEIMPVRVRSLFPSPENKKMGLYLVLPCDANDVYVLTDKAYGCYKRDRHPEPVRINCCICQDSPANRRFITYDCKHLMCCVCDNNLKCPISGNQYCPHCCVPVKTRREVKVRHGACPIDMCKDTNEETKGTIIVPCGCFVACPRLQKAVETDTARTIRDVGFCPYEACRMKITNLEVPYVDLQTTPN